MLAAALVALVAAAASPLGPAVAALGRDAFDGLNSWLRGEPGRPAPDAEQAGFAARNDASYAAFPKDTKLRLLLREHAGGKTFSLLGFRNDSSLCLRLVRSDRPAGRGANQCVTLRELRRSAAPALVASDAWFRFGDPETSVDAIFGFADDTVGRIELERALGRHQIVAVSSNAFAALRARPSGSVNDHPPYDPIVRVRAARRDGRRVAVPFIGDFGQLTNGLPSVSSYLRVRSPRPEQLPGPGKPTVGFPGGTIAWLERREPRGDQFAPDRRLVSELGTVVFARSIQLDPGSPFRIGLALIRLGPHARMAHTKPGQLTLCFSELYPLNRGATGAACTPPPASGRLFAAGRPLMSGGMGPGQLTRISGLAADAVHEIDLYLASGRIVPAALRDNAYTVEAPTAPFPAKLVAYDQRWRPLSIQVLPGPARPVPCPPAVFARPVSALPAPQPYERLDLATGTVNGQPIFGRGVAEVETALGRPDRVQTTSISNGHTASRPSPTAAPDPATPRCSFASAGGNSACARSRSPSRAPASSTRGSATYSASSPPSWNGRSHPPTRRSTDRMSPTARSQASSAAAAASKTAASASSSPSASTQAGPHAPSSSSGIATDDAARPRWRLTATTAHPDRG